MNFNINSYKLLEKLFNINKIILKNPILPILENFLFEITKNNLNILASDLQTSIDINIEIKSEKNIKVIIPSKILINTLKNLKNQSINFFIDKKKNIIEIKSNNGLYKISCEKYSNFPKIIEPNKGLLINIESSIFKKAINYTIDICSSDELKSNINGVCVNFNNSNTEFIATDGYRLVKYTIEDIKIENEKTIIIPRKCILLVNSIIENKKSNIKIKIDDNNIYFDINEYKIISKLIKERYPDYENVIPKNNENIINVNRKEILSSIKRVSIFSNQISNLIKIKVFRKNIKIFTEDNDFFNSASEEVECEYNGSNMCIGFNARLLISLIDNINLNEIEIKISNPNKACIIKPIKQNKEDLILVIMPIIVNKDIPEAGLEPA